MSQTTNSRRLLLAPPGRRYVENDDLFPKTGEKVSGLYRKLERHRINGMRAHTTTAVRRGAPREAGRVDRSCAAHLQQTLKVLAPSPRAARKTAADPR